MEKAFPEFYLRSYKRRFLGIVTEESFSCGSYAPYQDNVISYISCAGAHGDPYLKSTTAKDIPTDDVKSTIPRVEFFANGTVLAFPNGTARALSVRNGRKNGRQRFCTHNCGTASNKTIDFKYTNLYPGTVKV